MGRRSLFQFRSIVRSARRCSTARGEMEIELDEFAFRQFDDPTYAGTKIRQEKKAFEQKVNEFYEERKKMEREFGDHPALVDGYAPFCKHLFMPNFVGDDLKVGAMAITNENEHLIRTRYEARSEKELPVLSRYFPVDRVDPPTASFLDLILYSREQINAEAAATGRSTTPSSDAPWGLISIKAQAEAFELPMQPITAMRNALISEGGSGVPINREQYLASVEYWRCHATIA